MNTAELKLNIIRQVDTLNENVLKEVTDYIQSKINSQNASVFDSLTEEQKKRIRQAQQSCSTKRLSFRSFILLLSATFSKCSYCLNYDFSD